jgi:hypothetical protein
MHSLYVASLFRRSEYTRYWPALFWVSFIAAFGSGSLVNICFNDYPAWLKSDLILLTYVTCWYLVIFSPGDLVFKVYNILPVRVRFQGVATDGHMTPSPNIVSKLGQAPTGNKSLRFILGRKH